MASPVERVLFLTYELSFRGASILALRLAQGLESAGIETVILCSRLRKLDQTLIQKVRVVPVPGYTLPIWGRVVHRTVLHHLISQPPDVIHALGPRLLPQALWLGRTLNRPVVLSLADQTEAARIQLPTQTGVCKAIACVSDSVRAALPARLENMEQRVVLPGVPLDLSRVPAPILEEGRVPVVGMAGPLEVIKGGSFFLRACHRVIEAGQQVRIVVAGSGPEEKNLRKLATSLELDKVVTFVDDGAAMSTYLAAVDIFCLPSLQQGFGVIMLEAMALGRPAIASGVGGILSIIEDGKNGLIVPPSDSRALADRILELLNDPEKARRIAIAGQNLVEDRFTAERMVQENLMLYHEVVQAEPASVPSIPITAGKDGPA
ncbi:MAG: glycosyltransferase family 4 protein [Fuerstiella sp.]